MASEPRAVPVSVDVCATEIQEPPGGKRYAVYVCRVHVTTGRAPWYILRRYKDWEQLQGELQAATRGRQKPPSLPGKKLLGNMDPGFLETRRLQLQDWVTAVVRNRVLCESEQMWGWLQPVQADTAYGKSSSPSDLSLIHI